MLLVKSISGIWVQGRYLVATSMCDICFFTLITLIVLQFAGGRMVALPTEFIALTIAPFLVAVEDIVRYLDSKHVQV